MLQSTKNIIWHNKQLSATSNLSHLPWLWGSLRVLSRGINTLREHCIDGITANKEHCKDAARGEGIFGETWNLEIVRGVGISSCLLLGFGFVLVWFGSCFVVFLLVCRCWCVCECSCSSSSFSFSFSSSSSSYSSSYYYYYSSSSSCSCTSLCLTHVHAYTSWKANRRQAPKWTKTSKSSKCSAAKPVSFREGIVGNTFPFDTDIWGSSHELESLCSTGLLAGHCFVFIPGRNAFSFHSCFSEIPGCHSNASTPKSKMS